MDYSLLLGIEKVVPDYLKADYLPVDDFVDSGSRKKLSLTSEFETPSAHPS